MNRSTTELWENFGDEIRKFVARRVSDPDDAEDVLQDIFVKIHTRIDTLQDKERVVPWLYRIARNTIIDHYRSRREFETIPDTLPTEPVDIEGDPVAHLATGLDGMIACIPKKYQQALLLTEIQGLKQQELADQLGLSLSGAKSRVQRGRELLKAALLECCHFEFDRRGHVIHFESRPDCCQNCS